MMLNKLQKNLQILKDGNIQPLYDVQFLTECSTEAEELLKRQMAWNQDDLMEADILLRISNIAYNCTSLDVLPLDDGVYDQLIVIYQKYDSHYQVGSTPVQFNEQAQNEIEGPKMMCSCVDVDNEDKLYARDIWNQHIPLNKTMPRNMFTVIKDPISKRLINTTHKYPELVGTLDKCKFVLNVEAQQQEVFNKPSVAVFERDYIQMCLDKRVIYPDEVFEMVGELKYDGVSVEAEVCGDTIVTALSRGDTADNVATDLTPILGGYKFPCAKDVPKETFGIKFEAVITKRNLEYLSQARDKTYKNGRNAIIGLFSASDAYLYKNCITLIPISTSMDLPRLDELEFLNKYYHSGELNRHCVFRGNYQQILFQVKQFTESAEYIRPILPYMIDGVVISFTDPDKIKMLGRQNFVNKYQMAIKFNTSKNRTIFLGYTYSIGKTGDVIPIVHFKPCEFLGTIHNKQTIHSYDRFKQLNLTVGEEIDVEYVNDVLTYITKPDTARNRSIVPNPEPFIDTCPYCGSKIIISESGKSAKCNNIHCHERKIMKMVDMLNTFGFKDFGEERIRALDLTSFKNMIASPNSEYIASKIGPVMADEYFKYMNNLRNTPIADYVVMSAIGFTGLGIEKWKNILKNITIHEFLIAYENNILDSILSDIPGVADKTISTIKQEMGEYYSDISLAMHTLNIINYKDSYTYKPRVVLSGFRESAFVNMANANGFDCSPDYALTKNTYCVVTPNPNSDTTKITKAKQYGIPVMTVSEFVEKNNIIL